MSQRKMALAATLVFWTYVSGTSTAADVTARITDAPVNMASPAADSECACCPYHSSADAATRAGHPGRIAWYASYSVTPAYAGDYVGGDTAWFGGCGGRSTDDGTWGVDFVGMILPRRVWLNWSHGRRYQGGVGAYKTDGPHIWKTLSEHD